MESAPAIPIPAYISPPPSAYYMRKEVQIMQKNRMSPELPLGFSAALAQNGPAMNAFAALDTLAREEIIARAREARSKTEMRQIVSSLAGDPPSV